MKTRHMEEPDIPDGFEHFLLEDSGGAFSYEHFENRNKELVLISAPAEFDINKLKGEQFILNGCKSLDSSHSESEGTALKWEVHSSLATSDKHLNILLPSDLQRKHLISNPVSTTLNVVRDIHIPLNLKLPERKKKGTRLPKPIGLKTRWIPYGSDLPNSFKKTNVLNGVQHCDESGSYEAYKEIKDNTYKEKKSSKSQNIDYKPDSHLVEMIDKTNNIVDNNNNKKKKKKKEVNMTGINVCDLEKSLTDPMDVYLDNVQVNIGSESKEFTAFEDSVLIRASVIEDNRLQNSVSNADGSIDHGKNYKKKKEKNNYFLKLSMDQENEELILDKPNNIDGGNLNANIKTDGDVNVESKKKKKKVALLECDNDSQKRELFSTSPTIKSEDVYLVDHNTKKERKKKKKQYQDEEGKYQEPEDLNLKNSVFTGIEVQHRNIKEKDNENSCVSKKKKKKKKLQEENVVENIISNPMMYVDQTNMNEIEVGIDNKKEESLVDVSSKKHKKIKKKDGGSPEKTVVSINKKNDSALRNELIYKQNNFHQIKIEEEDALTVNEVQHKNLKEEGDENPSDSKKKKKKKKSREDNVDEDVKSNPILHVNQTNMNEVKVAINDDKEELSLDMSSKKQKKKKKKDSESQEKLADSINKNNEMTVHDEMIYKQNNFHQIKIKEENGFMEECCSIKNVKKKKRKRKRKVSLNEHNAKDSNTKSDDILSHSTHSVDLSKQDTSETNNLPESRHANMEKNKIKSKKRKYATVFTDHTGCKKQKLDPSIDSSFTKVKKKTDKLLLNNCDSDLDSDDEARIFGVVPKKRGFSPSLL